MVIYTFVVIVDFFTLFFFFLNLLVLAFIKLTNIAYKNFLKP